MDADLQAVRCSEPFAQVDMCLCSQQIKDQVEDLVARSDDPVAEVILRAQMTVMRGANVWAVLALGIVAGRCMERVEAARLRDAHGEAPENA